MSLKIDKEEEEPPFLEIMRLEMRDYMKRLYKDENLPNDLTY